MLFTQNMVKMKLLRLLRSSRSQNRWCRQRRSAVSLDSFMFWFLVYIDSRRQCWILLHPVASNQLPVVRAHQMRTRVCDAFIGRVNQFGHQRRKRISRFASATRPNHCLCLKIVISSSVKDLALSLCIKLKWLNENTWQKQSTCLWAPHILKPEPRNHFSAMPREQI